MVVISVSMSGEELDAFDELVEHMGYESRSGAVRDALYNFISQHRLELEEEATLVLTLTYRADGGPERVQEAVHDQGDLVRLSLHQHIDDRCLDLVVLNGDGERVHEALDRLMSLRDVRVSVNTL